MHATEQRAARSVPHPIARAGAASHACALAQPLTASAPMRRADDFVNSSGGPSTANRMRPGGSRVPPLRRRMCPSASGRPVRAARLRLNAVSTAAVTDGGVATGTQQDPPARCRWRAWIRTVPASSALTWNATHAGRAPRCSTTRTGAFHCSHEYAQQGLANTHPKPPPVPLPFALSCP